MSTRNADNRSSAFGHAGEPSAMAEVLKQNWWVIAIRGALAVLFGLVALLFPGPTILSLVLGLMLQDVAASAGDEAAQPAVDPSTHPRVARLPDVGTRQWDFAVDALIRGLDQSTS